MNVYLDMVGCRLNQSEIEAFARQFRQAGHTLVSEASQADLVVVNTCAVTKEAASDSRQKVRHAARSGASDIVVTGCWSTLDPGGAAALPGVKRVVTNTNKDHLVPDVLNLPPETFDLEPLSRTPLPGLRQRTRAFIKVQDGCDNRCTFCVTTIARGASHSRDMAAVLADVRAAISGGTREVVLTGVHLGSWGHDLPARRALMDLIQAILAETPVERLRLSSLEPWDLDQGFFNLWQDTRLCRHLHLPLQSGSAAILRRMARRVTPESFARLISFAREAVPEMAITTDVIVGFPGEGEEEFIQSLNFVESMQFAGGHVFSYSLRPGTAAARFPDQVSSNVRKQRSAQMRIVLTEAAQRYEQHFLGSQVEVLWESADQVGPDGWLLHGLTDNYLKVAARAPHPLWNEISQVHLLEHQVSGLAGAIQGG